MDFKPAPGRVPVKPNSGSDRGQHGAIRAAALLAVTLVAAATHCAVAATKVEFWHAMSGQLGRELDRLVADFNGSHPDYTIVAANKGSYTEAVTSALFAMRTHTQPAVVQVNEVPQPSEHRLSAGNAGRL